MTAYYNEIDPFAAQWLRNLIAAGYIAPGDVDERSIEDVPASDLVGYTQCHFFAGIGVWSYALRLAGWPDDREIWTGSCPCQPFSAAGAGNGFADERHLWPAFHFLIEECRPAVVTGEQVASKDAEPWLDLVQTDMEAMDYAFGALAFPSAGVGAPHIRDRTYFMAHAADFRLDGRRTGEARNGRDAARVKSERLRNAGELADAGELGNPYDAAQPSQRSLHGGPNPAPYGDAAHEPVGPINGFWRDADWLLCRDEKWRAVEPGTFPLADGATSRVGRLRAYGNAINAEAARVWCETMMECLK
jgi:DNA (cytosine-5)-methyltransferase 1